LVAIRQDARTKQRPKLNRQADDFASESTGPVDAPEVPARISELPTWDRDLLKLMVLDPSYIPRLAETVDPEAMESPVAAHIFHVCCQLADADPGFDFGRLMAAFDDPAMKNLLVQIDEAAAEKAKGDRDRWFADLMESYRRRHDQSARRATLAAAR